MVVSFQGLLMPFGNQLEGLLEGVGVKRARSAGHAQQFYDGLAKLSDRGFIWGCKTKE